MTARVAINGFGRMGRLALRDVLRRRALGESLPYEIVCINEPGGDAAAAAHLLQFDSVHGPLPEAAGDVAATTGANSSLIIGESHIHYHSQSSLLTAEVTDSVWADIDLVIDSTGAYRTRDLLTPYFSAGVRKVVVSAPVKDADLNIVCGVNDQLYDPDKHHLVTAASCTTNAIAPLISVLLDQFGIKRGAFTSIHALTNTQRVLDGFHKDLRRARSGATSLIPTTTGSATAIFEIYPELNGLLDGLAVRVPIAQASIADCTFELASTVSATTVNDAFAAAARSRLQDILGVESRPLVSIDYEGERRSVVVDSLSTRVVDGRLVKLLGWYDNETGYVARMMDLVGRVTEAL